MTIITPNIFTTNGTVTINAGYYITILAVGGGGGGNPYSSFGGTGGGGGQVICESFQINESTKLNITIGNGGLTYLSSSSDLYNGGTTSVSSSFGSSISITANGGQGASNYGGGHSGGSLYYGGNIYPAGSLPGEANAGGGGGGAGGDGSSAYQNSSNLNYVGGNGGIGASYTLYGTTYTYGGGGAGASNDGYYGLVYDGGGQGNPPDNDNASATGYGGGGGGLWVAETGTSVESTGYQGVVYLFIVPAGYYFKDINIYSGYNLTNSTFTSPVVAQGNDIIATNSYVGFPYVQEYTSTNAANYGTVTSAGIGSSGYKINNVDIFNQCSSTNVIYTTSSTVSVPTWATKMSALVISGGGGGGAGGGGGNRDYGAGGSGGAAGGVSCIVDCPIETENYNIRTNMNVTVGVGGYGGAGSYNSGQPGGQGYASYLYFDQNQNNYINGTLAGGGLGGNNAQNPNGGGAVGGASGDAYFSGGYNPIFSYWTRFSSNGSNAADNGKFSPGTPGGICYPTESTGPGYGTYPNTNKGYNLPYFLNTLGNYGLGGAGTPGQDNNEAQPGIHGSPGIVQIWFYT